jgi:myo-inositol-1(or 4)-monophosphatase
MPASALMTVMISAARKAGRSLARDFGEVEQLQVSIKGPGDFVSAADHKAEEIVFNELTKARQGYCFLMEERGHVDGPDKSHRWIVDPLDGTTNFLHGNPLFCISIGLERDGQMVAGVVYNPIMDEIFTAEKGKGAFLNDRRRLRVAARKDLGDCLVATDIPHRGKKGKDVWRAEAAILMNEVAGLRRSGSAALDLCWVAAGRYDGYWERGIKPWDMAAGMLIVREAGGIVTDFDGADKMFDTGEVLAANPIIHKGLGGFLGVPAPNAVIRPARRVLSMSKPKPVPAPDIEPASANPEPPPEGK